jgi:hypothetical protein
VSPNVPTSSPQRGSKRGLKLVGGEGAQGLDVAVQAMEELGDDEQVGGHLQVDAAHPGVRCGTPPRRGPWRSGTRPERGARRGGRRGCGRWRAAGSAARSSAAFVAWETRLRSSAARVTITNTPLIRARAAIPSATSIGFARYGATLMDHIRDHGAAISLSRSLAWVLCFLFASAKAWQ